LSPRQEELRSRAQACTGPRLDTQQAVNARFLRFCALLHARSLVSTAMMWPRLAKQTATSRQKLLVAANFVGRVVVS